MLLSSFRCRVAALSAVCLAPLLVARVTAPAPPFHPHFQKVLTCKVSKEHTITLRRKSLPDVKRTVTLEPGDVKVLSISLAGAPVAVAAAPALKPKAMPAPEKGTEPAPAATPVTVDLPLLHLTFDAHSLQGLYRPPVTGSNQLQLRVPEGASRATVNGTDVPLLPGEPFVRVRLDFAAGDEITFHVR